jgi:hypothetical protein
MDNNLSLRLDLDAFDREDLRSNVDGSLLSVDQEKPAEAYGEFVTIAVIVLAPIAIKALAVWLTKQRRRAEVFDDVEIEYPNGSRVHRRLHIRMDSSTTESQVVKQLVDGLNLDPKLIEAVAALEQ